LTLTKNAGMPENFRIIMYYEKQEKEGNLQVEINREPSKSTYLLSIRFQKIFFNCEYQLLRNKINKMKRKNEAKGQIGYRVGTGTSSLKANLVYKKVNMKC
jgi:hypothetical protein